MADNEVITFEFKFDGQDQFSRAMAQMGAAADQAVAKINAAFAQIKQPQIGGQQQRHQEHAQQSKEGIEQANLLREAFERVGAAALSIGSRFGESGKVLGEAAERATTAIAGITAGMVGLRTASGAAAKEVAAATGGGEAGAAAGGAAGAGLLSRVTRLLKANPITAAVGAAGALVGGSAAFEIGEIKKLEDLRNQIGATREDFAQLRAVSEGTTVGIDAMAGASAKLSEELRTGTIAARESVEQFKIMQDRVKFIRDLVAEAPRVRALAEHEEQDRVKAAQKAVTDAAKSAEEFAEAHPVNTFTGFGRTPEQEAHLKKLREAVDEAEHQRKDEENRAAETRRQRDIQEQRQKVLLERTERQARIQGEEEELTGGAARQTLFAAGRAAGVTDPLALRERVARETERLGGLPSTEALGDILRQIRGLPKETDRARLGRQFLGPAAADFNAGELDKRLQELQEHPERLREEGAGLASASEKAQQNALKTRELLSQAESKATDFVGKLGDASLKAVGAIDKLANQLDISGSIGKGLNKMFGSGDGESAPSPPSVSEMNEQRARNRTRIKPGKQSMLDWLFGLLGPESAQAEEAPQGGTELGAGGLKVGFPKESLEFQKTKDAEGEHTKESLRVFVVNWPKIEGTSGGGGEAAATPAVAQRGESISITPADAASGEAADKTAGVRVYRSPSPTIPEGANVVPRFVTRILRTSPEGQSVPYQDVRGGQFYGGFGVVRPPISGADVPLPRDRSDQSGIGDQSSIDKTMSAVAQLGEAISNIAEKIKSSGDDAVQGLDRVAEAGDAASQHGGGGDGDAQGAQHGGMILGAGTGTSDSIHIMASHGEYVVRAAAVSHLGRSFMDRINAAPLGFAYGGLIDRFATLEVPRFQHGGMAERVAPAEALHPVSIHLPGGQRVDGFHGTRSAVDELTRHAVIQQASSTGIKPSWFT